MGVETLFGPIAEGWTSMYNRDLQSKQNKEDRDYQEMVTLRQRQWDLDDWARNNAYNSPEQQMNRLRQAGLNPHLVYGKGADNTANMVRGGATQGPQKQEAPKFDFKATSALMAYQQMKQSQAVTDNLGQQNALIAADTALRQTQEEQVRSQKAGQDLMNIKYGVENDILKFDYGQKLQLGDLEISSKKLEVGLKEQALKLNVDKFQLEKMATSADVTQKYLQGLQTKEQTITAKLNNAAFSDQWEYLRQQTNYIKAQIENLEKTGTLIDGQTAKQEIEKQLAEYELGLQKRFATKKRWLELVEQANKSVQGSKEAMNPFNIGKNPFY
jgi:hypothetical protein